MAKQLKNLVRGEIENKFKKVDGGIVVGIRGLNSEKTYDLRAKLHKQGVKLHVVKNSLAARAFATLGYDEKKLGTILDGPVGIVYTATGNAGVVGAAKALKAWRDENRKTNVLEIKGGFMEKSVFGKQGVDALESLPGRKELLAMFAGTLQAPISAFAGSLKETVAKFAYAIDAVKDKKEKQGA